MSKYNAHTIDGDVLVVELNGELNADRSTDLIGTVKAEIGYGTKKIIIDCGGLTYLSSLGLGALIQVHARMKRIGGDVKLASLKGAVADIIRLARLDQVLGIHPDVNSARRSFEPSAPRP